MFWRIADLNIHKKFLVGFGILFLILVAYAGFSVYQMQQLSIRMDTLYDHPLHTATYLLEAKNVLANRRSLLLEAIIEKDNVKSFHIEDDIRVEGLVFQEKLNNARESFLGEDSVIDQLS
ncbi:MAG: MCP four helix bundle domain-containing protein [Proteocatella sp.]